MYSVTSPNLTSPKSKRDRIRELIRADATTREILKQVDTSKQYVYKERGIMKRERRSISHQSLSISDGKHDIMLVKDQNHVNRNTEFGQSIGAVAGTSIDGYDIPSLNKTDLMSMYTAFQINKDPSEVIAKLGLRPDIVEREHHRHLANKLRDPLELQNRLVSQIHDAPSDLRQVIEKSAHDLLTNDEIMLLIDFRVHNDVDSRVKELISDTSVSIPTDFQRFKCRICNNCQPGALFDRSTIIGHMLVPLAQGYLCNRCRSIQAELVHKGVSQG